MPQLHILASWSLSIYRSAWWSCWSGQVLLFRAALINLWPAHEVAGAGCCKGSHSHVWGLAGYWWWRWVWPIMPSFSRLAWACLLHVTGVKVKAQEAFPSLGWKVHSAAFGGPKQVTRSATQTGGETDSFPWWALQSDTARTGVWGAGSVRMSHQLYFF